ncbi:hypothetical protein ACOME3_001202 [Neoechinorhynchus agilis]
MYYTLRGLNQKCSFMIKPLFLTIVLAQFTKGEIPKFIHMIWLQGEPPDKYKTNVDECMALNPSWSLSMWTNVKIIDMMEMEYSNFVDLYDELAINEKTDLARFMILHSRGGIYLDIDHKCLKTFTDDVFGARNNTDVILRKIGLGLSTSFMASAKGADFILKLMETVGTRKFWFLRFSPYLHSMFSTGPVALTMFYYSYGGPSKIVVIPNQVANRIFVHFREGTWHTWDGKLFFFINNHAVLVIMILVVTVGLIFRRLWRRRMQLWSRRIINSFFAALRV